MLGTGMATLRPLLDGYRQGLTPAVSCNLALVWASVQRRRWDALEEADLTGWRSGQNWAARLSTLFPETAPDPA